MIPTYLRPQGNGETFTVEFDNLQLRRNYYQESILAAQQIEASKQGKLYLMYSGGVDSEYALEVFLSQGIEITPVIIKLGNYNQHDLDYAYKFCTGKGIIPMIIDIDFDHFVTSGQLLDISLAIKSSIHHRAATAYAIGLLDGTVICGDGEPYIRLDPISDKWQVTIYEHDYAVVNYYRQNNILGTPQFNRHTPEMMSAFLLEPQMKLLANNAVEGKLGSDSSKYIIYNRTSNFKIASRPKYHGYEKIESSEIFKHESFQEIKLAGAKWSGVFSEDYDKFIKRITLCEP